MDGTDRTLSKLGDLVGNRKYVCIEGDCVNSDIFQISINITIKV
jgi:hypothetical protein